MSFEYHQYLFFVIPVIAIYYYFFRREDHKFFNWIEDHWFLKRTFSSKVSRILYFFSMVLLVFSLLDLRGPEEKIETSIPDQKTIILIDKSASMLVEDVRPNRFKKAIMMARHFVKKAAGHQISIIVFSDTHKRVVPFTDDIDLLDSILGGMLDLDINVGGSELSIAMKEATSYFALDNNYQGGNLLVFTDGEEHDALEGFKLDDEINLAIVGIGTLNGGPIPLRRKGGSFQGYKKYNGKEINSRLDEATIKNLVNKTKNSRYWISLSYSLPTDEILDFFRTKFQSKLSKGQTRVRPVLAKFIVIPAVILYILSYLISLRRSYIPLALIFVMSFTYSDYTYSGDDETIFPQDQRTQELLRKMKSGDLDETSKLKIAEELLKLNKVKEATTIYQETIRDVRKYPNDTLLNMGTSLLKSGKIGEALELFDKVKANRDLSKDEELIIENNTLKAILKSEQERKDKDKEKEKEEKNKEKEDKDKKDDSKDKEDNSDEGNDNQKGQGQNDQKQNQNQKEQKPLDENKDKDENENNKDKKKDDDKNNESENKDEKESNEPKSVEDKENEIKKKRKMVKIPATLKQLMNDDRNLQKRNLKTNIGKDKKTERRDW